MLTAWNSLRPQIGFLWSAPPASGHCQASALACFSSPTPFWLSASGWPPRLNCSGADSSPPCPRLQEWVDVIHPLGSKDPFGWQWLQRSSCLCSASFLYIQNRCIPTCRTLIDKKGTSVFYKKKLQPIDSFINIHWMCSTCKDHLHNLCG